MDQRTLDAVFASLPERKVAVIGDFCIDRYLHIDPSITDRSRETNLDIHQVTKVRAEPGAAANVLKNLAALGVGHILPVGFIGDDGDGFELACMLDSFGVSREFLHEHATRPTPVYTKPLFIQPDGPPEERNRFDIFPREPLSQEDEQTLTDALHKAFESADALIVADYGEAGKAGAVTARIRTAVADLARVNPGKPVIADSRLHIDKFRHVIIKPNADEARTYLPNDGPSSPGTASLIEIGRQAAERNKRPVLITLGADGVLICAPGRALKLPAPAVDREADAVGAGDTVLAAVAACLATGLPITGAAAVAVVAASITVRQLGTCGAASPDEVRRRFAEYVRTYPDVVGA